MNETYLHVIVDIERTDICIQHRGSVAYYILHRTLGYPVIILSSSNYTSSWISLMLYGDADGESKHN